MYLFYVDESGSANPNDLKCRYFTLVAVGVLAQKWHRIDFEIDQIKSLMFNTRNRSFALPELKSVWLRSPERQHLHYLKPYDITPADLSQGMDVLYGVMSSQDLMYAGVVVDTQAVAERKGRYEGIRNLTAQCVHQIAYQFLTERLNDFLFSCGSGAYGLLIHDMVQSSQAAAGFQSRLKESHQYRNSISEDAFSLRYVHHLPEKNVAARVGQIPRLIGEMHFEDSASSNLLQIADLAAYNVLRQFQKYGHQWEGFDDFSLVERYPYFDLLLPRFVTGVAADPKDGIILTPGNETISLLSSRPAGYEEYLDEVHEPHFDDEYAYFDDGDWSSMNGRV